MHPVLARFLNLEVALETLDRDARGEQLSEEERTFAEVARGDTEHRSTLLSARGTKHPSEEVQAALLVLAAHASTLAVRSDEELGPLLARAREALAAEGASQQEADRLLASLVLEEAFGYDASADEFDRAFFRETLEGVPALAALTEERVEALIDGFIARAEPDWQLAHETAATALFEAAWGEGLEPINPEHVEEALATTSQQLGGKEEARALEALRRFLEVLRDAKVVGRLRWERLQQALRDSALALVAEGPRH